MNTLNLIKQKLVREQKVDDYNRSIAYRGVKYEICHTDKSVSGTFCYRGRTYTH